MGAAAVRVWLTRRIAAPQLLCDEFIYADIAKSVATKGHFLVRHEASRLSLVYPALIAPAWWADSMATAYALAKAIGAVTMTLAAVPFYLWARRLAPSAPALALIATATLLLHPAFNFGMLLMSETAFLPIFLLATFLFALMLERPTPARELASVGAVVLAGATRTQGLVLVLVLPTAVLLDGVLLWRASRSRDLASILVAQLRAHWLSLGALAAVGLGYLAIQSRNGVHTGEFGIDQQVVSAHYSVLNVAKWAYYHLGELVLSSGVIPAAAFVVVAGLAFRRPRTRAERAFVSVSLAAVFWLTLEIGAFTSVFAGTVAERYSFYLCPLLLLAFVTWLHQGLPRPLLLTAVAVGASAALVLLLPLHRFLKISPLYSSFGLYSFHQLTVRLNSTGKVELVIVLGVVIASLGFAVMPRRSATALLPVSLMAFFLVSSWPVYGALRGNAYNARYATGLAADSSWIEHELGRGSGVVFVYDDSGRGQLETSRTMLETEFWNRNVQGVWSLGSHELCQLPERERRVDPATGRIVLPTGQPASTTARYVVTEQGLNLAGRVVAERSPLIVYRVDPRLRIHSRFEGVYPDAWTTGRAAFSSYDVPPAGSTLAVDLSRAVWTGPDVPGRVRLRLGTLGVGADGKPHIAKLLATRRWVVHSGTARTFLFPAPHTRYRVEVDVEPTFVPADFGYPDSRSLGIRLTVRFASAR